MFDAGILMFLASLAWIGWLKGMRQPRAQFWVKFVGPIGLVWMTWYFIVCLTRSQPLLVAGGMEAGHITVGFMVGGFWALMARPKPPPADDQHENHQDGARHA